MANNVQCPTCGQHQRKIIVMPVKDSETPQEKRKVFYFGGFGGQLVLSEAEAENYIECLKHGYPIMILCYPNE